MSEAKKLVSKDQSASAEPVVFDQHASLLPEELGLPPLDQKPLDKMPPEPDTALLDVQRPRKKQKAKAHKRGRAGSSLLILFLIGFAAFALGVALASAVLTGILDLQTGWVKDLLHHVKDFLRHKSG